MEKLYIVTCISNPLRWRSRIDLARRAIMNWLKAPEVHVTLVEVAYGSRGYELADLAGERVKHVPVRATTMSWSKESTLGIGIANLPHDAEKIATFDADILFRRPTWATDALAALDLYPVTQPWDTAYDLGPNGEHIQTHKSFASLYHSGKPVVPTGPRFWDFDGGPYVYSHTGFAWCYQRRILDRIGGLFDVAGMGSADHHQAYGMIGKHEVSLPGGVSDGYRNALEAWSRRATSEINGKIGYSHGTIEHLFHGSKRRRFYLSRWDMFLKHGFDPVIDLKRNTHGVIEFSGHKAELEREWDLYLRSRMEDSNMID